MLSPCGVRLVTACRDPLQRPVGVGKLAGVQALDASVMLPVKRSDSARAASFFHVLWIVKPQAQVINLNRVCRGILRGVGNTLGIMERIAWSGRNAWRNNERLNIEAADEFAVAHTVLVGVNIPLIPG